MLPNIPTNRQAGLECLLMSFFAIPCCDLLTFVILWVLLASQPVIVRMIRIIRCSSFCTHPFTFGDRALVVKMTILVVEAVNAFGLHGFRMKIKQRSDLVGFRTRTCRLPKQIADIGP